MIGKRKPAQGGLDEACQDDKNNYGVYGTIIWFDFFILTYRDIW
jgi:hypothetical protein